MKNSKIFAAALAVVAALAFTPEFRARASAGRCSVRRCGECGGARCGYVGVYDVITRRQPTPEGCEWLKAEVVHADARDRDRSRAAKTGTPIHTFNFSPELQGQDAGDRSIKAASSTEIEVSILFMPGQTVALQGSRQAVEAALISDFRFPLSRAMH